MKYYKTMIILTSLIAVMALNAQPTEPLNKFLDRIYEADSLPDAENWTAIVDEVFTIYEDESFTDFKTRSTRTLRYTFQGDSVVQEVLSEKVEGEEIDGDKDDDEDEEEHSEEMSFGDDNMPFNRGSAGDYEYSDGGMTTIGGESMRVVNFEARERDEEHFDGAGWFEPETARIRRLRISYADNPRAVKFFVATLGFDYIDGYRVMDLFEMDIKGRYLLFIKFNVSLRQKYREIELLQ